MGGRPGGRFKSLDARQRKALAEYLTARLDYLRAEPKYTQQLLAALQDPARGDNKRMRQFLNDVVAPARRPMREAQLSAVAEAADVDVLSELIPTLLGGLTQAVDIPMLVAAINVDNDVADQVVDRAMPVVRRIVSGASTRRRAAG
jgi:hypothetical protein